MNKKLLSILVLLIIAGGATYLFLSHEEATPKAIDIPDAQTQNTPPNTTSTPITINFASSTGTSVKPGTPPSLEEESTDIFFGYPFSRVDSGSTAPGSRFEVQVTHDVRSPLSPKGNADGVVVVNATNTAPFDSYFQMAQQPGGHRYVFYTVYDSQNKWYIVLKMQLAAILD